jgi:hypothetical protein
MKKTAFLLMGIALLSACNNTTNEAEVKIESENVEVASSYQYYGDTISSTDGATESGKLFAMFTDTDSMDVKVTGTVNSSCKVKGCWMKMDLGNDKEMHVTFKDYGFFVPTNLNGETATIEGYAKLDTLDVDYLRHLAEDAGKEASEIEKITEPEVTLTYVATGVVIEE